MSSLLYPLLLVILLYAFPYFIVYLRTRQTTFLYPRFHRQSIEPLSSKAEVTMQPGDTFVIETPGGGGYGLPLDSVIEPS